MVRGGAVNQDGRSAGITAPNGDAQRDVFRGPWPPPGRAEQVGYIETHGTGTRLGDPIEARPWPTCTPRERRAVYLGAVKTTSGIWRPAGIAGLIKAVMCLQRAEIPPTCTSPG
ncbi:hypothetical protein Srubr_18170 [Streptomyces rubradiris]|uniref:Ketosynthase family 3 (KS3) domain-containing protein n=1 Tax=Streptomyces rubradiris TaxID=285531 RepID=A0ABQ3R7Y5_STRRR|nr:hypothetical protein [Streptomyces rubradiris]GHI51971.1 hypothetical protein Srubr_18170 [Streptomyces rubradiris]